MKTWLRLAIAIVILAAVVGVLYWPKKPGAVTAAAPLAAVNTGAVRSISIVQPGQTGATLVKAGSDWKLSQPYAYPADAAAVSSLLDSLGDITGAQKVGAVSNLAAFGLDHPSTVTLGLDNGQSTQFVFGGDTPTGGNSYMRLGQSGSVEIVPSDVKSSALKSAFLLQDKSILHFPSGQVTGLTATSGGKSVHLAQTKGAWPAAEQSNVQSLLDSLSDGQMTAMQDPTGKDAGAHGLAHPAITLTLIWKGGAGQLDIGAKSGAAEYFARNSSGPAVFTLSDYLVTAITTLVAPAKGPALSTVK